jgi:hypothetical protein
MYLLVCSRSGPVCKCCGVVWSGFGCWHTPENPRMGIPHTAAESLRKCNSVSGQAGSCGALFALSWRWRCHLVHTVTFILFCCLVIGCLCLASVSVLTCVRPFCSLAQAPIFIIPGRRYPVDIYYTKVRVIHLPLSWHQPRASSRDRTCSQFCSSFTLCCHVCTES